MSKAAAAAVTGGWRAGSVAVLAVAKRLEGDGAGAEAVGTGLTVIPVAVTVASSMVKCCFAPVCAPKASAGKASHLVIPKTKGPGILAQGLFGVGDAVSPFGRHITRAKSSVHQQLF